MRHVTISTTGVFNTIRSSMVLMLSWNGSGFERSSRPCVWKWASPLRRVAMRSCFLCPR